MGTSEYSLERVRVQIDGIRNEIEDGTILDLTMDFLRVIGADSLVLSRNEPYGNKVKICWRNPERDVTFGFGHRSGYVLKGVEGDGDIPLLKKLSSIEESCADGETPEWIKDILNLIPFREWDHEPEEEEQ